MEYEDFAIKNAGDKGKYFSYTLMSKNYPDISLNVYPAHGGRKMSLVYFHGGGFLFGEASDLPDSAIDTLTEHGIEIIALDYPLAPAYSLSDIIDVAFAEVLFVTKYFNLTRLALFGRSAGAYICYQVLDRLKAQGIDVFALASFYGFYDMDAPQFKKSSLRYSNLKQVPASILDTPNTKEKLTRAALNSRYSLYVYARQTGSWLDLLGKLPAAHVDLESLPPLFLAASANDEDVPYSYSKSLWRKIPGIVLKTYYNVPHELDSYIQANETKELYQSLALWLLDQLN